MEPLLLPMEGCDRVVIKKTFIEVEDLTPTALPASYNSDSVLWARLQRQGSPGESQDPFESPEVAVPQPHLASLNKQERLSRSSVSTIDSEEPEGGVVLRRDLSPEMLMAATNLAVSEAMEAAGIALRQPLDSLLSGSSTEPSSAPRRLSLLEAVAASGDTTVMLRNLPNNYSRTMVCTMMDKEGFKGKYDFLYLPIDFRSKASLGYAFVNLTSESEARQFWKTFDGYTKWVLPSAKVCSVSWSGPHQGQEAHVLRYRDSPIMHGSVPDEFKPVIFEAGTGRRVDFPEPTKKLRAPRRRPLAK